MQIIKKNTKVVTSQRHTVRENSWLSQFLQNTNEKKKRVWHATPKPVLLKVHSKN